MGDAPEEVKEEIREKYHESFYEEHLSQIPEEGARKLKSSECDKRPREVALIENADKEINSIMKRLSLSPYEVPARNIHIVPPELFKEIFFEDGNGRCNYDHRVVVINADRLRNKPVDFGSIVFHEMFHLKGHVSIEVKRTNKNTKDGISFYRTGLGVHSSIKNDEKGFQHSHFTGLEEALTSEMEKRYFSKMICHPSLKDQKEWLESQEAQTIKKELAEKNNLPIDEIRDVDRDKIFSKLTYPMQRKVLSLLTSEIYKRNNDKFNSEDEVLDVFVKAHFTGELLEIARFIKNAFGKESFEVVGTMDAGEKSAVRVYEFLMRAKNRHKSN